MLAALLDDFAACPGVRVVTLLSPALPAPSGVLVERGGTDSLQAFARLAETADVTLVVAPEFDGVLERLCRTVEAKGGGLLGPSAEAVRLTADKLALAHHLRAHGIPTPPSFEWPAPELPPPLVCKPRDGAGSQATFLIADERRRADAVRQAAVEGWTGPLIGQPFIDGVAVSVAVLIGPKQRLALPAAEQHQSRDGRFRYLGGRLPLPDALDRRARELAEAALRAVEGLTGYVGVDLVLGEKTADDAVIEINPRVTTSYVGLRALAEFNLAEVWLNVVLGRAPGECPWRSETVVFRADGTVIKGESS
jgi:predicted ATP-grasp superfamily ATP-dependent carboligase